MKRIAPIFALLAALWLWTCAPTYADRNVQGSITALGGAVTMSTDGVATVRFVVSGTWTGTLGLQSLGADYATWQAISFYRTDDGTGAKTQTFTVNVAGKQTSAAMVAVRIVSTVSWTGTATVSINGSSATGIIESVQTVAGNFSTSPNVVYNTSPPVLTNGQTAQAQGDSAANLKVYQSGLMAGEDLTNNVLGTVPVVPIASTYSPTSYQSVVSGSQVVSGNIKNAAGQLLSISYSNVNAATRYLWITNATSAPANALAASDATVLYIIALPTVTSAERGTEFFTAAGKNFSTGISFGFSTSATSYTAGTAADHILDADVK